MASLQWPCSSISTGHAILFGVPLVKSFRLGASRRWRFDVNGHAATQRTGARTSPVHAKSCGARQGRQEISASASAGCPWLNRCLRLDSCPDVSAPWHLPSGPRPAHTPAPAPARNCLPGHAGARCRGMNEPPANPIGLAQLAVVLSAAMAACVLRVCCAPCMAREPCLRSASLAAQLCRGGHLTTVLVRVQDPLVER